MPLYGAPSAKPKQVDPYAILDLIKGTTRRAGRGVGAQVGRAIDYGGEGFERKTGFRRERGPADMSWDELTADIGVGGYSDEGPAVSGSRFGQKRERGDSRIPAWARQEAEERFGPEADPIERGLYEQLAGPEIPVLKSAQRTAGRIARTAASPLDLLPGATFTDPAGRRFGRSYSEAVGSGVELLMPTRPGEVALELIPGIGMVPGAASAGRRFGRAAIKAVVPEPDPLPALGARTTLRRARQAGVGGGADEVASGADEAFVSPQRSVYSNTIEGRTVSQYQVGDHLVQVDNMHGRANDLFISTERASDAGLEAFTSRVPGGSVAGIRRVGQFIERLVEANPTARILADPSDGRRLAAYKRLTFKQAEGLEEGLLELDKTRLTNLLGAGRGRAPPPREPPAEAVAARGARRVARQGARQPSQATGAVAEAVDESFAGNIRLSKYPEDIRTTIKDWADANPDVVQTARRGTRSDAEVLADARQLVEEMGGKFSKLQKRWKPGQAWNAEEITAIRGTLRQKTEDVLEAARASRSVASAGPAADARLLQTIMEQARVQEVVHGVTAESGRALRAFRQEASEAGEAGDLLRLQDLLRRSGVKKSASDLAEELAGALGKLDLNNPVAVNNFIRNMSKPGLWDYVMEVYINGLLSGPTTHIINNLSNTVNTWMSPVERGLAAAVDLPLAKLQGRPVARFFKEVPADVFGALEGYREGAGAALTTLRQGISPKQASKWEFRRTAFKGNLGRVIRAPGTALEAADTLNYSVNYRAALNASIVRKAKGEGLNGNALVERIADLKANPTEALIRQAGETAEYRLFRLPGELANFLSQATHKWPALRFVIPFVRTPVNIAKFGLERSPAGLVNPSLWRNLAAKSPEASDQIARVALGSSVFAGIAAAEAAGQIEVTGAAPKSAAERDRFYREGKQAWAIRIGGKWIQYQRLEPANQPIAQYALVKAAIDAKDKTVSDKISQAVLGLARNFGDQTFVSGLSDLFEAFDDPERFADSYARREVASGVPFSSLLRQIAQAIDPTIREPRTIPEQVQVGIPGLTGNVPPKLTAFGEEARRESPPFSPIRVTSAQQSAVDAELGRLKHEVGFTGNTIGGTKLTRAEKQEYQKLAGEATKAALVKLFASAEYDQLDDLSKEEEIEQAKNHARAQARHEMLRRYPAIETREDDEEAMPAATPRTTPEPARRPARYRFLQEVGR